MSGNQGWSWSEMLLYNWPMMIDNLFSVAAHKLGDKFLVGKIFWKIFPLEIFEVKFLKESLNFYNFFYQPGKVKAENVIP